MRKRITGVIEINGITSYKQNRLSYVSSDRVGIVQSSVRRVSLIVISFGAAENKFQFLKAFENGFWM